LGGARPKASVRGIDGSLAIAKFPHKSDTMRVELWEALALGLAEKAGIPVPGRSIESIEGKSVLILRRFDRNAGTRVPFLSAMSMLGAGDRETHSYMEIADAIRRYGARPTEDVRQLWRRIVFNVLISNVDDHLRNHGFLYAGDNGWILSPAYDLNPVPTDLKPRILCTAIDVDDATASIDLAFSVAEYFSVKPVQAKTIAGEVARVVSTWREEARRLDLSDAEITRVRSAFEHEDLKKAQKNAMTTPA
jgi:serine/threonine-protein kinase HipA